MDILSDTTIRRRLFEHGGKLTNNKTSEESTNGFRIIEAFQDFDDYARLRLAIVVLPAYLKCVCRLSSVG